MLSMWTEAELRGTLLDVAALGALLFGTLFVVDVAMTLARRRGRRPGGIAGGIAAVVERRSPAILRHLAELTVTAALAVGAARPAGASDTPIRDWLAHAPTTTTTTTVPLPSSRLPTPVTTAPTRGPQPSTTTLPTTAPAPRAPTVRATAATAAPPVSPRAHPAYVVKRGDCLWRIAAERLGAGATNAAIDAGWRSIYAVNRAAIGDDPNLIHPGLTLTLPPHLAYR